MDQRCTLERLRLISDQLRLRNTYSKCYVAVRAEGTATVTGTRKKCCAAESMGSSPCEKCMRGVFPITLYKTCREVSKRKPKQAKYKQAEQVKYSAAWKSCFTGVQSKLGMELTEGRRSSKWFKVHKRLQRQKSYQHRVVTTL